MRAMAFDRYGGPDNLTLRALPIPTVAAGEVLVRIRAAGIDPGQAYVLRGSPFIVRAFSGWTRPRIPVLGRALAGIVEAVGEGVDPFQPGDRVYGELEGGAYAEFVAAPEKLLAKMPANLSFEEAAAVPLSATTALQAVRDAAKAGPGKRVLINGASGGVGTFAVQIARWLGAETTAVCSAGNADLARSLGADHVVDYATEDFTTHAGRYDAIVDLIGNHPLGALRRALAPGGVLVMAGGDPHAFLPRLLSALVQQPFVRGKMAAFMQNVDRKDLDLLRELIEAGTVRPVIDQTLPLGQAADAIRRQLAGHARGKTVLTM
jgi:NADPH:quinone reductase-like Zn-dependent oxidoreductase